MSRLWLIFLLVGSLYACGGGDNASGDVEKVDNDGDGVINSQDAFPNDPKEQKDSDDDGVGDNADKYPHDPLRSGAVGGAAFLHSAPDVGLIYLDGDKRPYGSVNFSSTTSAVELDVGIWNVSMLLLDSGATHEVIGNSNFVVNENEIKLFAITGNYSDGVSLQALALSDDTEEYEGDKSVVFINVSHIHPQLGALDIYFLADNKPETLAASTASATVTTMGTSEDIRLTGSAYIFVVTEAGNKDSILFRSRELRIYDIEHQTIVLGENPASNEMIRAYYYLVEVLFILSSDVGDSSIRLLNAVKYDAEQEQHLTEFNTSRYMGEGVPLSKETFDMDLGFAQKSAYSQLVSGNYDFDISGITHSINFFESGSKNTLVIVGRVKDNDIYEMKLKFDQQKIATEARVSLTHLAYKADYVDMGKYKVYITAPSVDISLRVADIQALIFKGSGTMTKKTGDYTVRVMSEDNLQLIASLDLSLINGQNRQLVLIEKLSGAGFQLIDITE
ncbi:MAG: DUF4397 domain-containing protein [Pseudomonadales bacterium]|nr:DUF4397 domain-containing protein [Pseudomonadales bacterium]